MKTYQLTVTLRVTDEEFAEHYSKAIEVLLISAANIAARQHRKSGAKAIFEQSSFIELPSNAAEAPAALPAWSPD